MATRNRQRPVAASVRTPLWSVILPKDARTAFFVTITGALFGALWIIVRETRGQPAITVWLAGGVLLLFAIVILSHHLLSLRQMSGGRRFRPESDQSPVSFGRPF